MIPSSLKKKTQHQKPQTKNPNGSVRVNTRNEGNVRYKCFKSDYILKFQLNAMLGKFSALLGNYF